jgi:hypothetical protein
MGSMETNMAEESAWAAGVAAQLRLLQVTCADAQPAQRREFLGETVTEAIKKLPSGKRSSYLAALAERFPAWNVTVRSAPPPAVPVQADTPVELLDRLLKVLPDLPETARQTLARKVVEAGWVRVPSGAAGRTTAPELQAAFDLPEPPAAERAVKLLCLLSNMMEKLGQVACRTLENLPERPDFKAVAEGDLREAMKDFLAAAKVPELEPAAQAMKKMLERHGRIMVGLMASHAGMRGVPSAGRDYARWFLDSFSPQIIEDVVGAEKAGMFGLGGGLEERCWKRYVQRFREQASTPEHIDRHVKEAVANSVERICQLRT